MTSLQSGFRIGNYQILSPLGAGGMGQVYRRASTLHWMEGSKQIQAGKPTTLFRTFLGTGRPHGYAVDLGGQRFLIPTPVEKNMLPITILLNWSAR